MKLKSKRTKLSSFMTEHFRNTERMYVNQAKRYLDSVSEPQITIEEYEINADSVANISGYIPFKVIPDSMYYGRDKK